MLVKRNTSLHGTTLFDFADLLKLLPEENWQDVIGLYKPGDRSIAAWTIDEQAIVLNRLFSDFTKTSTSPVFTPEVFAARLLRLGIDNISTELAIAWCKPLDNLPFQLLTIMFPSEISNEILSAVLLDCLKFSDRKGIAVEFCATIIPVRDALNDRNYLPEDIGNDWYNVMDRAFTKLGGKTRAKELLVKIREALDNQYMKQSRGNIVTITLEAEESPNTLQYYDGSNPVSMYQNRRGAGASVEIELSERSQGNRASGTVSLDGQV